MKKIFALLSGLIFGLGLILAGMANPAKVLAFLDIAGAWDPSLMLVMVAAIAVAAPAFAWAKRHQRTLCHEALHLPINKQIDKRLILGSVLFGIGWGIAGICPGPALVLLGQGEALWFAASMLLGMAMFSLWQARSAVK